MICDISGHRPSDVELEVTDGVYNQSLNFSRRCAVCGEQLPMSERWVKDRIEWEKNRPTLPDMSILLGN